MNNFKAICTEYRLEKFLLLFKIFFEASFGPSAIAGKPSKSNIFFHGVNPFFPWRSSLGVMPYALGVTISAGTVLCVSHPGLEPAMAALRGRGRITSSSRLPLPV